MWIADLVAVLALQQGSADIVIDTGPHPVAPETTVYEARAACRSDPVSVRIERGTSISGTVRYREADHAVPDAVLGAIESSNHGPAIGFACLESAPTVIFTIYRLEGRGRIAASQAQIELDKTGAMVSHRISKLTTDQYGAMYGTSK